jgi:hypothetical protein
MTAWWHVASVYIVAGGCAAIVAWSLLKTKEPPGVAYVTFAGFAGVVLLFLVIDTGRIAELPALQLGNAGLYEVKREVRTLRNDLLGYETEDFPRGKYEVSAAENDVTRPFRATLWLQHEAVPDSVWVFENGDAIAPTFFDVERNRVTVRVGGIDPKVNDYVVRYFRMPASGGGDWGPDDVSKPAERR